jgi:radical SAM superfamily enzyme YgiQ (UPF0313 family)
MARLQRMTKNILFVQPNYRRWPVERYYVQYFPRGILCLAAELRRELANVQIEILDLTLETDPEAALRRSLTAFQPQMVAISVHALPSLPTFKRVVSVIREAMGRKVEIVAGGSAPTFLAESLFRIADIDFVVRGFGEEVFVKLVAGDVQPAGSGSHSHIISRAEGPLSCGSSYSQIGCVEGGYAVSPAYDLLDMDRYRQNNVIPHLEFSRGCPFSCTFCGVHLERGFRVRNVTNAIDEIELLNRRYGFEFFALSDDTLTADRSHFLAILEELERRKLSIRYRGLTRLDLLDEDLLSAMKRSGCTEIGVGVESFSNSVLREVNKGLNTAQIRKGVEMVRRSGIDLLELAILGFDQESHSDVMTTLRFLHESAPTVSLPLIFHPMPGTSPFLPHQERLIQANDDELFELIDQTARPFADAAHLSKNDITKYFIWFHYALPTLIDPEPRPEFAMRLITGSFPRLRQGVVFTRVDGHTLVYGPEVPLDVVPALDVYRRTFDVPVPEGLDPQLSSTIEPHWNEFMYELLLACNGDFTVDEIKSRLTRLLNIDSSVSCEMTDVALAALRELHLVEIAEARPLES